MDNAKIGKRIKWAREDKNMSQEELGNQLGLNKSSIQRYESGQVQRIKLPILENMAKILNVNPSWLVLKSDDPNVPRESELETITDNQLKFALFGTTDIDDELLEDVKKIAQIQLELKKKKGMK